MTKPLIAVILLVTSLLNVQSLGGMRWHSWLRHSAPSQKVAGSIPDGVTGIFH